MGDEEGDRMKIINDRKYENEGKLLCTVGILFNGCMSCGKLFNIKFRIAHFRRASRNFLKKISIFLAWIEVNSMKKIARGGLGDLSPLSPENTSIC